MRTRLDAPAASLDAEEAAFVGAVRQYGWHRMNVLAEEDLPSFTYTTGFWVGQGAPEIILFALEFETAGAILADLYEAVRQGRRLPVGSRIDDLFGNAPAYLFDVGKAHYAEHLGWSRWFYRGDDFPCRQLVWPDRSHSFPWEPGFDERLLGKQPDLSERGWSQSLKG